MKQDIPLGKQSAYASQYDASLLYPIPRSDARRHLSLTSDLPFQGKDRWTAYEISWLDKQGKPQCRMAEFYFDCDSPCIVESKSFKLYLNSFNQTRFDSEEEVLSLLQRDLSQASGKPCQLYLFSVQANNLLPAAVLPGECIDDIELAISHYAPAPDLLTVASSVSVENEILYSHLLKTNCPVTDQPDWASIFIAYSGSQIERASLLAYIISFREHQDFHENCVERIFCDILTRCQPVELSVYARYTRRGGLDINPLRSNSDKHPFAMDSMRLSRQ